MRKIIVLSCIMVLIAGLPAFTSWETLGRGIEYRKYTLSDPNHVYAARMTRSDASATIESTLPQGQLTGAREIIRTQAARLDDALNCWSGEWGLRNEVVVAINGDWIYSTGLMYGGQAHSGWYAKRVYCEFGGSHFAWTYGRVPILASGIEQGKHKLTIKYKSSGVTQQAHDVNRPRASDELIVYTPQYDVSTRTDGSGVEVLARVTKPVGLISLPGMVTVHVTEIRKAQDAAYIPFDHIVLSAQGKAAEALLANASVGDEIGISQEVSLQGMDWSGVYAGVSGGRMVVSGGQVVDNSNDHVYAGRHPRTAVAYNDEYIFFVVCDGRSTESRGMSAVELGEFIVDTLGGVHAMMLDGGGSSTMVIKGSVVNVPSGGAERAVGNGLMMVNLKPKMQSRRFSAGRDARVTGDCALLLGPGTNFGSFKDLAADSEGKIVDHLLNGIYATGDFWWNTEFDGVYGWVAQKNLRPK